MNNYAIYALHGFLGRPQDWDVLNLAILNAVDLFDSKFSSPGKGLLAWGKAFNKYVSAHSSNRFILGYSMGGRLALQALCDSPMLYRGAIFVSTNPGNADYLRRDKDKEWGERFLKDPWDKLMDDWNRQSVFISEKPPPERFEENYNRKALAETIVGWSVATQKPFYDRLKEIDLPILWIAGERDTRYVTIAKQLAFRHDLSKVWIAPECGHRVLWENPNLLRKQIETFVQDVNTENEHAHHNAMDLSKTVPRH